MEKENEEKSRKITGAILSSIIVSFFFILMMIVFTIFLFMDDAMPLSVYFYFMATFLIPTIGIIVSLYFRMREIESGEEEEAKKY